MHSSFLIMVLSRELKKSLTPVREPGENGRAPVNFLPLGVSQVFTGHVPLQGQLRSDSACFMGHPWIY